MRNLFVAFLLLLVGDAYCQQKYFVYLKGPKDKNFSISKPEKFLSPRSIKRRETQRIGISNRDLPVNAQFLDEIKSTGAKILGTSKWLNAVLLDCNTSQINTIKSKTFFGSLETNGSIKNARLKSTFDKFENQAIYDYGNSLSQIKELGVDELHKKDFTGKNILVGILDSGFEKANTLSFFKHIFDNKRVIDTWDFVDREVNVYNNHSHGTNVMSCIGGLSVGFMVGTAPNASFVLYVTEDVGSETRIEEAYWLLAAEKADSIGVDVINSSLGYSEFDDGTQNYQYKDLNGDKTIAARAADFAVGVGISVVVSAGNDGNKPWKYISTPADADSVLAVGAIDASSNISSFSSYGPNAKNNVKPELVARGTGTVLGLTSDRIGTSNGTSFSSPLLAGFVASFKEQFPTIPAMKLREIFIQSGHLANKPNERFGYGIPNYQRAAVLAENYLKTLVLSNEVEKPALEIYPNPSIEGVKISYEGVELGPNVHIQIFNSLGLIIEEDVTYAAFNECSKKLKSGTYILKLELQSKPLNIKFLKL